MKQLGTSIYTNRKWVVAVSVVFVLLSVIYGTTLFGKLSSGGFQDEGSESYVVLKTLENSLPYADPEIIVLFSDKTNKNATDSHTEQEVKKTLATIKNNPQVENITTYYDTHSPALLSKDQKKTFATINLKGTRDEQNKTFPPIRKKLVNETLNIQVGGQAATYTAFNAIIENDLKIAETISFSLLAVLLIIVFRGAVAALLPLIVGGFAILGAFLVTRLLANITDISQFSINAIIFIGLGLAIDYSLFIVSRFREELRSSGNTEKAITLTMATAGRTVFFSGITVMVSLLALLVFPLGFLKSMGIGGAAAVIIAGVGALLLLPAILSMLGPRIYALSFGAARREKKALRAGHFSTEERRSVWYRLSLKVMKHPVLVVVSVLTPLMLAGAPFLHVELQSPDYRSLPKNNEVRAVSESLRHDFSSKPSPIQIVIKTNGPKDHILEAKNLEAVNQYSEKVKDLSRVTSIDSILTSIPGYENNKASSFQNTPSADLQKQYVSQDKTITYLNVYYRGDMFSPSNQQLIKDIRRLSPPANLNVLVGGNSAELVDLLAALNSHVPYALAIILITLFILLFLMLGSVIIPLKAMLLNILSLAASFGTLVWIFQDGHFEKLLGFASIGSIDANQPILIFAIAFGLSMDYAVFLLSRIKEQYDQNKNTQEAVAEGVQKTGSIITSAALLLIVVVGAFGTSQILLMKQLAVGLVLAIAIDAVVIRMLLVPASMKLLGRYNWWAPRPLKRLHERLGLSD